MATNQQVIPKVVKLETNITERLARLGDIKNRSLHWLMKEAIVRYLEQEEYSAELERETLSRWQEAESGKVVSHSAMMKWLDTWGTDQETGRPPCGN